MNVCEAMKLKYANPQYFRQLNEFISKNIDTLQEVLTQFYDKSIHSVFTRVLFVIRLFH